MRIYPKTFISYAWESNDLKKWVKKLASNLRENGIDAQLDQWELVPGDKIPLFMEQAVRENDYVLIICTPNYKERSDKRIGGVGYEGDIITSEILEKSNHRKFIPILRYGTHTTSMPSWLQGKYYVDFSNDQNYETSLDDVLTTLFNMRENAPPIGRRPEKYNSLNQIGIEQSSDIEEIKIKGILIDEVTQPLNDGTRGSALYRIPFKLSNQPNNDWINSFISTWNRPPEFSLRHRPGIASVVDDKIILDGTDIEEVERYHKKTLKLSVEVANKVIKAINEKQKLIEEQNRKTIDYFNKKIEDQRENEIESFKIFQNRNERQNEEKMADFRLYLEKINKRINFDD